MSEKKFLKVSCPECRTSFNYYEKETRPFCSDQCKSKDFIGWTSEDRAIVLKEQLSDEDIEKVITSRENVLH